MNTPETTGDPPLHDLLAGMIRAQASDLHMLPGYRPTYRIHGRLTPARDTALDPAAIDAMTETIVPAPLRQRYQTDLNLEFSIPLEVDGRTHRFRTSIFRAQSSRCACFRHIPTAIPSFDWMGLPQAIAEQIIRFNNGLVIITGVTGSGKSTTLAAIVELLNRTGGYRVITIEDPIEYVYEPTEHSLITQREVGTDCESFFDGLRFGLRQDPDVILVGEIRDTETARMALTAAETGHLILTTMHTKDAKGAVTRYVDLFQSNAQDEIRSQLAFNLRCVIAQHLLPATEATDKRVLGFEKMLVNTPVRAAIHQGRIEAIESAIQTGRNEGMIRLDDTIQMLLASGKITPETARRFAKYPDRLGQ